MPISRRELLRRAAALSTLHLTSGTLTACGDDSGGASTGEGSGEGSGAGEGSGTPDLPDLPTYSYDGPLGPEDLFQHGVASGDPNDQAVILWTRVSPGDAEPIDVWWEVSLDDAFTQRVDAGWFMTDDTVDYTVKLDAFDLQPGTTYYYRFFALGRESVTGRTRTAPTGAVDRVRFGMCSCSSFGHGYFHGYQALAERRDLDAVIHLGDYIYEYGTDQYGSVRAYEPSHEILTLEDYRMRYAQYRRDVMLQEAHRVHPFIAVWDDHETADNSYRDGAGNHTEGAEGAWADRKAAATQAYAEWMPFRDTDGGQLFRTLRYGDLLDLILLDTRIWGRDEQPSGTADTGAIEDPDRSLLGAEQEAWLQQQLAESTAQWRLLGQQVMVAHWHAVGVGGNAGPILNEDAWDGYEASREKLFDAIEGTDNVVVLTGDIHSSWANNLTRDPWGVGYDPETGEGSVAVEFVTPGITSPGFPEGIGEAFANTTRTANPHVKFVELEKRGYVILDVTSERVQASWYQWDDITVPTGAVESHAGTWAVYDGTARLVEEEPPSEG